MFSDFHNAEDKVSSTALYAADRCLTSRCVCGSHSFHGNAMQEGNACWQQYLKASAPLEGQLRAMNVISANGHKKWPTLL